MTAPQPDPWRAAATSDLAPERQAELERWRRQSAERRRARREAERLAEASRAEPMAGGEAR